MKGSILEVRDWRVRRGARTIVGDVEFQLSAGETLGVIGPNGGGKTSLLLGLRGLLPSDGTLQLGGLDPRVAPRAAIARQVAVVPQRNEFAFSMQVDEMVLLGRAPYRKPWQGWGNEDRAIAARWLERLGLSSLADRPVDTLSGGERRRVFIARALVQETPLVFLDEPFAGLDPAAQEKIVTLLAAIAKEHERTMVIVLHELLRVERLCDRVLGVARGTVPFTGPCDAVLDVAALEDLYGVPWIEARRDNGERILVPGSKETP